MANILVMPTRARARARVVGGGRVGGCSAQMRTEAGRAEGGGGGAGAGSGLSAYLLFRVSFLHRPRGAGGGAADRLQSLRHKWGFPAAASRRLPASNGGFPSPTPHHTPVVPTRTPHALPPSAPPATHDRFSPPSPILSIGAEQAVSAVARQHNFMAAFPLTPRLTKTPPRLAPPASPGK